MLHGGIRVKICLTTGFIANYDMKKTIEVFQSVGEISEFFIQQIQHLITAQPDKKLISIALSGGSTPEAIYHYIASYHKESVDWSRIIWFWGDERCVPPKSNQSNYKLAMDHLLNPLQISQAKIFRIQGENDPEKEAKRYSVLVSSLLPEIEETPRFDLIWLGLGEDGHIASIFPPSIGTFRSDRLFEENKHPVTGQKRITATGRIINNASKVLIIATGVKKAERVAQILNNKGDWRFLPASLVNPVDGELVWVLDRDAAVKTDLSVNS